MGCKPSDTLIEGNHRLRAHVESKQVEKGRYHGLVRKLIWLTYMRPDTIFAINVLSQFMCSPNEAHIKVVFEILKNLKGTHGIGLLFSKKDQVFFF